MKSIESSMVYQRSLMIVFLRSVLEVLGKDCNITIENSLNKGLYYEFNTSIELDISDLEAIKARMNQIVSNDEPFIMKKVSKKEAEEIYKSLGLMASIKQLPYIKDTHICMCSCGWFNKSCHGKVLKTTGELTTFDLQLFQKGIIVRYPSIYDNNRIPSYVEDHKIGEIFKESSDWAKKLNISYVADLNEKIENGKACNVIRVCEALHEKKIIKIAQDIVDSKKHVVLISGPSSSGKTSFAQRLAVQLQVDGFDTLAFSTDDFYVNRKDTPLGPDGKPDYECLEAIDIPLFTDCVNQLLEGNTVDMPIFDFKFGVKTFGKNYMKVSSNTIMIIEGIHGLNPKLTENLTHEDPYKIYISALTQLNMNEFSRISTSEVRLIRRMIRDSWSRESNPSKTLEFWHKVREGEEKNIFPYQEKADSMFNSALPYELSVLKKHAVPLLEKVPPNDISYDRAQSLLSFLSEFISIDREESIYCNSIIKEFIGGSCFFE